MKNARNISAAIALGAVTALGAPTSGAWSNEADFGAHVNGHEFKHARVEVHGCTMAVKLDFSAPEQGYSDARNKVRNYHLFRARVKFAKGQALASKVFGNGAPGERVYTFEEDTTAATCWVKEPNKIVKVDVIGCRNRGCDVGTFE